jgi:hypothetical protein
MKKICSRCKEEKDIELFVKDKSRKSGYISRCKKCVTKCSQEYAAKNKNKRAITSRSYYEKNKQYIRDRERVAAGIEVEGFIHKADRPKQTYDEVRAEQKRKKERLKIDNPIEYENALKEKRIRRNLQLKERRRRDKEFRLKLYLCNRLKDALRSVQEKLVNGETLTKRKLEYDELFGCSFEAFSKWIESHWNEGMTWENYGNQDHQWSLDHHYPCSAFDLTDKEQQRQCFHYTNTYPMWSKENRSKNDTIPTHPRENLHIPDFAKNPSSSIESV